MKNRNRMIVNCVTASLMYYWSLPALAEQSSSEIKIVRDEYGMPHIYANDTWHLFYGYGYVVAQDRLFQMEMARRSTQGTVAEVLGNKFRHFQNSIFPLEEVFQVHRPLENLVQLLNISHALSLCKRKKFRV